MTLSEVKKALLELMQTIFPAEAYKYYSMAVIEDYDRPCFFTQIKPVTMAPANYNSRNNTISFYITYMQEEIDEADALDVIQKLRDLFGLAVKVNDRAVKVVGFDYDFIGSNRNIPEITVDFEWMDRIEHVENLPLMEEAEIITKIMEE